MKPKTMILMVVAVGCGLAASYMTSQLLAERNTAQEEQQQQEKVKILVAKKNLVMGLLIKDPKDLFKEKLYIKGEEPEKALTDQQYDRLKDRRLIKPLTTDQFVSEEDLLDKNQNSLGSRLQEGMRAVGLKVDISSIAGGFASLPMSRVDIITVLRRGDGDSVSRTLLENVLVVAADQETGAPGDGRSSLPASTVTVALSPADSELVLLAAEMGSLKLALRAPGDEKKSRTKGATGEMVFKGRGPRRKSGEYTEGSTDEEVASGGLLRKLPDVGKKEKPAEVKPQPVPAPPKTRTHILTIYNGDQGRRVPFKLDLLSGKVVSEEITQADPEPPAPVAEPAPKVEVKKPEEPTPAPVAPGPNKTPRRKS